MKYRDARLLKPGDQVIRKNDNLPLVVDSVELYGQFKTVKINCLNEGTTVSLFNEEVV